MIKLFKKKQPVAKQQTSARPAEKLPLPVMWEILAYFPIGKAIDFYPGLERTRQTPTILLAYNLNGKVYYRSEDVMMASSDATTVAVVGQSDTPRPIECIHQFFFIIPLHRRTEIDYRRDSRSSSGKLVDKEINDFRAGNQITLVSSNTENGAPHIETLVRHVTRLKTGYYANQEVALLEPLPDSLVYIDRRAHKRVETRIPAKVRFVKDTQDCDCFLMDFCEESARIQLQDQAQTTEVIREGKKLILTLSIGRPEKTYQMSATITLVKSSGLVISFTGKVLGKQALPLEMIDLLTIKSILLNQTGDSD